MDQTFSAKLEFILKALSLSRGQLAAELGIDKSAVGRWVTGTVLPSTHSLSRLTSLLATRIEGFAILDWDQSIEDLGERLGVGSRGVPGPKVASLLDSLPSGLVAEVLDTTARRAEAYEGFFRSTRPYALNPGRFLHDQVMIRRDDNGLLRFVLGTGGVFVHGLIMPQQTQLFIVASEQTSGAFAFGILNGVNTRQAGMLDGIILNCALDSGRTPTASAVVLERIADLTGERAADDARFHEAAHRDPMAPNGSVPDALARHLVRDIGPTPLAAGGDWLLRLPITRSLAGGLPVG
jgi:transcriptional regulator with XRE-family HTH domain